MQFHTDDMLIWLKVRLRYVKFTLDFGEKGVYASHTPKFSLCIYPVRCLYFYYTYVKNSAGAVIF